MESRLPPGPPLPAVIQAILLFRWPERFLVVCRRRYGKTFRVRLGRMGTFVYLTDPADVRTLFRGDTETFHAGEANGTVLEPLLGPTSVLVTDGAAHRRQRRLMMPPFHGESISALTELMADIAAAEISTWPVGERFASRPRLQAITLEVILRTVVGAEDEGSLRELRAALPPVVDLNMFNTLQFMFPSLRDRWPWKRFRAVESRANAALYAEIERARNDPALDKRPDVLAMLVRARDEDGTPMSEEELRDQLVTLLLAGHETTATGLAWALERLIRHPETLARACLAAEDGDDRYLDAVVAETLRVRPVVPDVTRRLTRPAEIAGYLLPAGTMVDPAIPVIHTDPGNYADAETFDPGRFAERLPDPSVWIPFGGGNRRCIGASFASTEMRIVLGEILRRTQLQPTSLPGEAQRVRHVTLVPRNGAMIRVTRRVEAGSPVA